MRLRYLLFFLLVGGLLAAPGVATESVPATAEDGFRGELEGFLQAVEGLEAQHPEVGEQADALRRALRAAPSDDLRRLQRELAGVPGWSSVPDRISVVGEAQAIEREAGEALLDLRELRAELQAFGPDARLSAEEAQPYLERIAALRAQARTLSSGFSSLPGAPGTGPVMLTGGCDDAGDCWKCPSKLPCYYDVTCLVDAVGCLESAFNTLTNTVSGFVNDVVSDIKKILSEIAALPGKAWSALKTEIENLFNQLLAVIPNDVDDFLAQMGLDDPDWFDDLLAQAEAASPFDPPLDPPCPDMGTNIPGIGEVGSIRAEWTCRRGIDWFAAMIYDVAPDDIYDVPVHLIATALYYPINYFCLCMEAQSEISFDDAQKDHRDFVDARLNADVWTRATQLSVDILNADLASAQSELDGIHSQVIGVDGQADTLHLLQDEQDRLLDALRAISNRMAIENNLLDDNPDTIAAFQMPESAGGYLERVREILAETIQMNLDAGESVNHAFREMQRGDDDMASEAWEQAYGHYQSAYREAVKN